MRRRNAPTNRPAMEPPMTMARRSRDSSVISVRSPSLCGLGKAYGFYAPRQWGLEYAETGLNVGFGSNRVGLGAASGLPDVRFTPNSVQTSAPHGNDAKCQ